MKYFYDTEFIDDGHIIELISIGIVADDGREYYAVNQDVSQDRILQSTWLRDNVWPSLPTRALTQHEELILGARQFRPPAQAPLATDLYYRLGAIDTEAPDVKHKTVIADEVRDFLLQPTGNEIRADVELWADYAAYDHVALAQLFGPMIALPHGIPMFTNDLQQLIGHVVARSTRPLTLPVQKSGAHNALADARHLKACYDAIRRIGCV